MCTCYTLFKGVNCATTGIIFSSTTLDILLLHSQLDSFKGTVLHLKSERAASSAFYMIEVESDDVTTFTMRGDGYSVLHKVRSETPNLSFVNKPQQSGCCR